MYAIKRFFLQINCCRQHFIEARSLSVRTLILLICLIKRRRNISNSPQGFNRFCTKKMFFFSEMHLSPFGIFHQRIEGMEHGQ
jgi:hypothetical protein